MDPRRPQCSAAQLLQCRLFFLGANVSPLLYPGSRLDCGTGPGLVRSRHRVQLRAWNHLAVFRHDWAVWLQLNRGPREEGRSQVGTLGWVGDAISKSWFQITKFPFKLSTNVAFSLPPADTKRPLHEYKGT